MCVVKSQGAFCLYISGFQPVVRVQLVVREGLPSGIRVTSIFSQKPGFTAI